MIAFQVLSYGLEQSIRALDEARTTRDIKDAERALMHAALLIELELGSAWSLPVEAAA